MDLLGLIVLILIVGFVGWAVTLVPMPDPFKQLIWGVCVLVVVLAVISMLTGWPAVPFRIGGRAP